MLLCVKNPCNFEDAAFFELLASSLFDSLYSERAAGTSDRLTAGAGFTIEFRLLLKLSEPSYSMLALLLVPLLTCLTERWLCTLSLLAEFSTEADFPRSF